MLRKNSSGNDYAIGSMVQYQSASYYIESYKFIICRITNTEKSILVTVSDENGIKYDVNFWLSGMNTDPNIYLDNGIPKLAEISEGDTVCMVGFKYDYKGKQQFNCIGGYFLSSEPLAYSASFNIQYYIDNIHNMIDNIKYDKLKETCNIALNNYNTEFISNPAANSHHHNYVGGLLQHTYEVMKSCCTLSDVYSVNKDVVIASALFHDIMKVKEYDISGTVRPYLNDIGHVVGSAMTFTDIANSIGVDNKIIEEVQHCILSHHGKKEWGSPIEPKSPEAMVLFCSDLLSAYINPSFLKDPNIVDKGYYDLKI